MTVGELREVIRFAPDETAVVFEAPLGYRIATRGTLQDRLASGLRRDATVDEWRRGDVRKALVLC